MSTVTRLDYCQFLLVTQTNYTLKYFAEHSEKLSYDAVKRYLEEEKITARLVWESVKGQLVRQQYSGNVHRIIKGIGVVTCVYINPDTDQFWIIDYRIFDPDGVGKSKLAHVREMLDNAYADKQLPFRGILY